MGKKTKAIFFDADGTLFHFNGSLGKLYAQALNKFGIRVDEKRIDALVGPLWKQNVERYLNAAGGYSTNALQEQAFWVHYVSEVLSGVEVTFTRAIFEEIYQVFARAHSRTLQPDVASTLASLKARGFILGVLSNHDQRIVEVLRELGLYPHFDYVFCSVDLGYKKPAPVVFHKVAEACGIAPESIVYVGDSVELDYEAAHRAGWSALLLSSVPPPDCVSISQLVELLDIVDS